MQRKNLDYTDPDYFNDEEEKGSHIIEPQTTKANLLGFSESCFDTEIYRVYNPFERLSVSGPKWSGEGGVGGYRLYKIETKIKNEQDDIVVYRRYNDFCWLIEAVLKDYPACIVPPIPPKNPFVAWYNDETESLQMRKQGLENFLLKITSHGQICGSTNVMGFLKESDYEFEQRKLESGIMLDKMGTYAINKAYSYFSYFTSTVAGYVWSNDSAKKQYPPNIDKTELDRFAAQERYFNEIKETFDNLHAEVNRIRDNLDETSRNYSSLSEGMSQLGHFKDDNGDLSELSKDIAHSISNVSVIKKNELDNILKKLKEPVDDYRLMIQAAMDACNRRRAIVMTHLDLQVEVERLKSCLDVSSSIDKDKVSTDLYDVKKKEEDMKETVQQTTRVLNQEINLFKQNIERDLQTIMQDFIQGQAQIAHTLQIEWQKFLALPSAQLSSVEAQRRFSSDRSSSGRIGSGAGNELKVNTGQVASLPVVAGPSLENSSYQLDGDEDL